MRRRFLEERNSLQEKVFRFFVASMFVLIAIVFLINGVYAFVAGDNSMITQLKNLGISLFGAFLFLSIGILFFKVVYPGILWAGDYLLGWIDQLTEKSPNLSVGDRIRAVSFGLFGFTLGLLLLTNGIAALKGDGFLFENFDTPLVLVMTVLMGLIALISLMVLAIGLLFPEDKTQTS